MSISRSSSFSLAFLIGICCHSFAVAQWTTLPSAVQPGETYSPDDFFNRGIAGRAQVGQAGCFRLCDDEGAKRCSPYITWTTRPCQPQFGIFSDMIRDLNKKTARIVGGAGSCARGSECQNLAIGNPPTETAYSVWHQSITDSSNQLGFREEIKSNPNADRVNSPISKNLEQPAQPSVQLSSRITR